MGLLNVVWGLQFGSGLFGILYLWVECFDIVVFLIDWG